MSKKINLYFLLLISFCIISDTVIAQDWIYTTRPGDNLWNISKTYLKSVDDWKKLKEYNSVNIPKQLSPGIRLRIPVSWLKHQPESVTITFTRGNVHAIRSSGEKNVVQENDQLLIGDRIIIGSDASATLRFADGSIILLESESELILDSLSAYENTGMVDTQLRLQRGGLETQVIPLRKSNSRYEILTPAAVAAVRGTRYRVDIDTSGKVMRAEVLEGKVNVATTMADQDVNMGFGTLAEKNKRPLPPRKLLKETDLSLIPKKIRKLPYTVEWPALEGARSYRVQVVTGSKDESVVYDLEVAKSVTSIDKIIDGNYILKVRGIDDLGLEGKNGIAQFSIDTSLLPALPAPILNDPTLTDRKVTFSWPSVEGSRKYHVELATDLEFNNILISESIDLNEFTTTLAEDLNSGYFRVRSESDSHQIGTYSDPKAITIEEHGILYFFGVVLLYIL